MPNTESPVDVAKRHVQEAVVRVERQKQLMLKLVEHKHSRAAEHAAKVLKVLEESLRLSRVHLELEIEHHGDPGDQ